ncbi:hypothetical protein BASA81_006523 [Batrachochytrium salamandrivorans]|nr:hypothetical protein BASA81_006523 [Batrachochytrium salamandrivorans]
MAKKKAKDLRGYATTSVAPLATPAVAIQAAATTTAISSPPTTPSASASTQKKKKKEAAAAAEVARINNIKPLPLPPLSDPSATMLKLPPTPDEVSSYVEYEDQLLSAGLQFDESSLVLGDYSRFDLETVYETLLQRDRFQREDLERAMLVCRGNLAACHDWLSANVPFSRLPEGWCFVPVKPKTTIPSSSSASVILDKPIQRRAPSEIIMLDQDDDITTYGAPVNKKPIRLGGGRIKISSPPSVTLLLDEEDEESDAYGRFLDKEFDEEFGDLTQDMDYMQEEEEEDEQQSVLAPSQLEETSLPVTSLLPPLVVDMEVEEDPEVTAEIAAELAKMQDLVWHDGDVPSTVAVKPLLPKPVEDECFESSLFEEDVGSTPIQVTIGAPRFEGRIPANYRGNTPKALLLAFCKKQDMPNPVFIITSALLGRVTVRTSLGETLSYEAEQICANNSIAQELVSVKALFYLRALPNDTSYLTLPPDFRPVWKQLLDDEAQRALQLVVEESKQRREFVNQLLLKPLIKRRMGGMTTSITALNTHSQRRIHHSVSAVDAILPLFEFKAENQAHLPIYTLKDEIVDAHFTNQVVIISAETGSGKTTQVPQFLLEAYAMRERIVPKICITQPRRISATSVANRVADELGDIKHQYVGYTIRGSSTRRQTTSLLFCTSGVLLQHFSTSKSSEFDIIILDEVHERTVEGDVLMVCLKRMLVQNTKLKVILMSATMNSTRLSEYFGGCPVLHSSGGRVFPVDTLFLEDLLEHTGFTPEATGQDVIKDLTELEGYSKKTCKTLQLLDEHVVNPYLIECALEYMVLGGGERKERHETWLVFLPGLKDIFKVQAQLLSHREFGNSGLFQILLLHSTLVKDFSHFFDHGQSSGIQRRIVLCTNIAETGITLPHVSGVVDTCRVNELRFNEKKNLTILKEEFCSKASCEQRKGRAGRVKSGICIRLVSRYTYHQQFPSFSKPEIQRVSLSEICLKLLNHSAFSPIGDFFAEALDPPGELSVQKALERLQKLGCLVSSDNRLSELGKMLSKLPMDAALGKILVFGALMRCTRRICLLVALISSSTGSLFVTKKQVENLMLEMQRFVQWEASPGKKQFAREYGLDSNGLLEVQKLRNQYFAALQDEFPKEVLSDEHSESNRMLTSVLSAGLSVVAQSPSSSFAGGRFVCQDNVEARAKLGGSAATFTGTGTKFYTYLERMKVGQVFVSGLTPLHPTALVMFSHLLLKFTPPTSRVDLGGNAWGQLRCVSPRTCSLFSLTRVAFDKAVERCLETKQLATDAEVFHLVAELVLGAD